MARSLIRLPQLNGASIPQNTSVGFKFAEEGAGGDDLMTFDTSASEILFDASQTVKILGDLFVMGSRTLVNSEVMTVSDKTIVAGLPDMKDASFDTAGVPSTTVTVTANGHGLSMTPAGQKFYAITNDPAIPEGIYEVSAVNSVNEFEITLAASATLSAVAGSISGRIQDSVTDQGGYLLPTEGGLIGLKFRDSDNDLSIQGQDFHVALNSQMDGDVGLGLANTNKISMNGSIQGANALIFDGATNTNTNRLTLAVQDPSANQTIELPDATGLVPVAVGKSASQAQGAEDFGLQLSSAGLLEIDINDIGESLVSGSGVAADDLDAADLLMLSDTADGSSPHRIKKTSLGQIQSFLAAGGTQKASGVVSVAIPLSSGNAAFVYSAANSAPASQQFGTSVITAFEAATESSREIYLNGILMREGASNDCEVDQASDTINFKFDLEADDVVTVVARA